MPDRVSENAGEDVESSLVARARGRAIDAGAARGGADHGEPEDGGRPKEAAPASSRRGGGLDVRRVALFGVRAVLGVVVLLVAIGIAGLLISSRPEPPKRPIVETALIVRTIIAQEVPMSRSWEGFATVRARTMSEVSAQVSAAVVERPDRVRVGERVQAGETLFVLDDAEAVQRLASAEAVAESLDAQIAQLTVELESTQESLRLADDAVRLTRNELERLREATRGQGAAPIEVERLERQLTITLREREALNQQSALIPARRRALAARLAEQETAIALARLDLERTTIVSPIDGVIDAVFVDVGQRVSVGTALARVIDPTRLEVPVRVPVTAAAELSVGDPAVVRVTTMPDARWTGSIVRISPQADVNSRTVEVFVEVVQGVPPSDGSRGAEGRPLLRPGQFVMGRVARSDVNDRVIVPRGAIRGDRVVVMNGEGRAEPRVVVVSHFINERWPGIDPLETEWAVLMPHADGVGLMAGERVVVSNLDDIRTGMRVRSLDATEVTAETGDGDGDGGNSR